MSEKCSPPMRRPSISITVRSSPLSCREESLYGLRMGTTCSTPGAPWSPSLATCSRSPTAPITVTSSPREGWARAPQDSIRSMTAWISSSVAVAFITIIMCICLPSSSPWTLYVGADGPLKRRSARGPDQADGARAPTERLAKSPGGIGVGVAETGGACAGGRGHGYARSCSSRQRPKSSEDRGHEQCGCHQRPEHDGVAAGRAGGPAAHAVVPPHAPVDHDGHGQDDRREEDQE